MNDKSKRIQEGANNCSLNQNAAAEARPAAIHWDPSLVQFD